MKYSSTPSDVLKNSLRCETLALDLAKRGDLAGAGAAIGIGALHQVGTQAHIVSLLQERLQRRVDGIVSLRKRIPATMMAAARAALALK